MQAVTGVLCVAHVHQSHTSCISLTCARDACPQWASHPFFYTRPVKSAYLVVELASAELSVCQLYHICTVKHSTFVLVKQELLVLLLYVKQQHIMVMP